MKMDDRLNIFNSYVKNSQPCLHPRYLCNLPVLEDEEYCAKHILENTKNKSYKRCSFSFANRKRCMNAVRCSEKGRKMICEEHGKVVKKPIKRETFIKTAIFHTISQNLKEANSNDDTAEHVDVETTFVGYKNVDSLTNIHKKLKSLEHIMEEEETPIQKTVAYNVEALHKEWESSEGEDDGDDSLQHTILTEPEIVRTNLFNLKKLLEKYECEKAHLEHQYKQLDVLYKVREVPVENDSPLTEYEQLQLKTWKKYTRNHALTALVQSEDARIQAQIYRQHAVDPPAANGAGKCIFVDDVITCDNQPLNFSKYCLRHITHDPAQILFRNCGVEINGVKCKEPIVDYASDAHCVYHAQVINGKTKGPRHVKRAFCSGLNSTDVILQQIFAFENRKELYECLENLQLFVK